MKPIISRIRRSISTTLLTVVFGSISLITLANGNEPIGDRNSETKTTAEVKYVTGKDGDLLIHVLYNNVSGGRFSIAIMDEYGNQLYQNFFFDRKFDKKFMLADPESFDRVTFVIRNYTDNTTQRFQVDATNRLVEDVQVKEVR